MRVLVLGGSGMLGHMICRVFGARHNVLATCRSRDDEKRLMLVAPNRFAFVTDVEDRAKLAALFREFQPDVVVNCVGVVKQKLTADGAIPAIRINALFPHELAELAVAHGAKAIFVSTDCVFSGQKGMYTEVDRADPTDIYGQTKLLGEIASPPHLTIRTSFIGRELVGACGLVEWFLKQRGKQIQGYTRAIFSGFTTAAMSRLLLEVVENCPSMYGVWHVASEPISKANLLRRLVDLLQLDIEVREDPTFECDRSLDGRRFIAASGLQIPSWDEMLVDFVEDVKRYESWRS